MNFFLLSKHKAIEENVLVSSKILYELIDDEKHIDELFMEYAKQQNIILNLNIERVLYLSLTFLFAFHLITVNNNMVKRIKNDN
ncbi:hypothetical protein [Peribacillus frigoritolerans]|uniref:hypothetical protein n=1 Tax=Peribacillus frigoritolerans TaxID=450367 RepID=UPI002E1AD36F|nr:hypothetical protein [Peribacillus frigoritolerans]MED3845704.1 hypothetical protein [Peribacillus frigoritolerans]